MAEEISTVSQRYLRGVPRDEEDRKRAAELAAHIGLPYDDLLDFRSDPELFRQIPVDVMVRYQFVPLERQGDVVVVVMAACSGASPAAIVLAMVTLLPQITE